ncbi:MAG: UDP-3-O-(3-hydroxymyristoyl)glucosamine N-acyltransferase [Bdellovibrionales bacterium]|nr:UDP-3-O-(3-hydroxymyristoyl)glucosamine N-acyltransferase [Bdellovibrionales bacterium]
MSERLASLADIWPAGPAALAADLEAEGFRIDRAKSSALAMKLELWKQIRTPRSSDTKSPQRGDFCYLAQSRRTELSADWGLVFISPKVQPAPQAPHLCVDAPDAAIDFVLRRTSPAEWSGESNVVPAGVTAETGVVIGPDCQVGAGTVLEAGVRLGARVRIGRNCRIGAHSRIADDTIIGNECVLTGCVSLGGQGFGFVKYPRDARPRPRLHVGRVVIEDRVRLGAFVAVDRGVFEDTCLRHRTSLDNIVQVAHNCTVGEDSVLCSLVGLSGSTRVGDRVTIAGLVGTKGHLSIGSDVTIAAQSGVTCDISDGETVKGYPPRPLNEALKLEVLKGRLPELFERLKTLEKRLEDNEQ